MLLNPGSVGQPRDGDPRAAWLLLDFERMFGSFRRVAYPIERTQDEMREAAGGARNSPRKRRMTRTRPSLRKPILLIVVAFAASGCGGRTVGADDRTAEAPLPRTVAEDLAARERRHRRRARRR